MRNFGNEIEIVFCEQSGERATGFDLESNGVNEFEAEELTLVVKKGQLGQLTKSRS